MLVKLVTILNDIPIIIRVAHTHKARAHHVDIVVTVPAFW